VRKGTFLFLKRAVDISGALFGLIFLIPLFLAAALLVRNRLGTPVFFKQERAGKEGKPFTIYKFRTMTDDHDEEGNLLPDEKRLTRFGAFLRSTSIDELPELWNVLKGEMSLVGPRPLHTRYIPRYSKEQARRLEVRPGLTGYAQVYGRGARTHEEKIELDVQYVERRSFLLDLRIIWATIRSVLGGQGEVYEQRYSAHSEFEQPADRNGREGNERQ